MRRRRALSSAWPPVAQDAAGAPQDSWRTLFDSRYRAALLTVSLGVGLFSFNEFLVSTALPSAVRDVDGAALLSWAVTVYLVPSILGGTCAAAIKQRLTTRVALFLSGLIFLLGTVVAGSAASMAMILLGRALQGAGDGVIAALCYALIPALFPSRLIARVFGVEALVWAMSASAGPLVSGWITWVISWRAAFLVNVPLVFCFLALVPRVTPREAAGEIQSESWGESWGEAGADRLPWLRLCGIGAGIMLVALAAIQAGTAARAGCLAIALLLLCWAVASDRASPVRLFPTGIFRLSSRIGAIYWVILLMPLAQAISGVYLVLGMQQLWGLTPMRAGAIAALMALSWSASGFLLAGRPALRVRLAAFGPSLNLAGLLGLLAAWFSGWLALVMLSQIVIGSGFGISWANLSQRVMEEAQPGDRDRATALLPTVQSAGYAIGAAVAGVVVNVAGLPAQLRIHAVAAPLEWGYATAAVIAAVAVAAGTRVR